MKAKINLLLIMAALLITVWGCYPEGPEYTDETDIVFTNYREDFDFKSQTTFSLPDSVVEIGESDQAGNVEFVNPTYGDVIINSLRKNMTDRGWVEVDESANPDVILLPSATTTTTLYFYYDWAYWGWYYPGYSPGWGWYYPPYYYPSVATGYRSGTLLVQMTYPDGISGNDNIPVEWVMVTNGILEGSTASLTSRLEKSISQAFIQSPYLKK